LIPKICERGTSFKEAARYLVTEKGTGKPRPGADTLAIFNMPVGLVLKDVREAAMVMSHTWQWRAAIKEFAGKKGGVSNAPPVWHGVVNFDPSERPTDEEMKLAASDLLAAIGLDLKDGFETFMVAHRDTNHHHVHIIVNLIHPETGLAENPWGAQWKAQKWATKWEKERGQNFCPDRNEAREAAANGDPIPKKKKKKWLSREEWEAQKGQDNDPKNPASIEFEEIRTRHRHEWAALKGVQTLDKRLRSGERNAEFMAYKAITNQIFNETKERRSAAWKRKPKKVFLPLSTRSYQDWQENMAWKKFGRRVSKEQKIWRQREKGWLGRVYNSAAIALKFEKGKRGGKDDYEKRIRHILESALADSPLITEFHNLEIVSLKEEAEIYGFDFDPQESKEQNIAALTAAIHQHRDGAIVYEDHYRSKDGSQGVYGAIVTMAGELTKWEATHGGLESYEHFNMEWSAVIDDIAARLITSAADYGIVDPKALVFNAVNKISPINPAGRGAAQKNGR